MRQEGARNDWRGWVRRGMVAAVAIAALAAPGPSVRGASKADSKAGKEQYEKLCLVCHGAQGMGDGQALRGLPVRPKSFADPTTFKDTPDQTLFDAIKKGGAALKKSPMMPPFGDQLKDGQIWDLVAYIKSLAPPVR